MHRFASQLKIAIESSGLSRTDLCEMCDVKPAALSKYLNGKAHPRKQVLGRLSKAIPDEQLGDLYTAYLMDYLPDEGLPFVEIHQKKSKSKTLKEDSNTPYQAHKRLPKELEEAFAFMRDLAGKSPVVANSIKSTYQIMRGVDLDKI